MSKHTPGPRKRGAMTNGPDRIYADDGDICKVTGISNGGRWSKGDRTGPARHARGKANARLIAAAPELLAALDSLMQPELQIEATKGGYCIFRFTSEQVAMARAAIAKAEGKA